MTIDDLNILFVEALESNQRFKQLEFVWKIMNSPFTDYHYSLITDTSTNEPFRKILWSRFDQHGVDAENLLISKLEHNEDVDFHAEIIFYLGRMIDKKGGENKEKVLNLVKHYIENSDDYTRNRAIIVLGWIGNHSDIPILIDRLLNDTNNTCRAWAATAFMQMDLRMKRKNKEIDKRLIFPAFLQAIKKESDSYTLGMLIFSLQEISGKNFRLSNTAVEYVDTKKIEKAKTSAINFLISYV